MITSWFRMYFYTLWFWYIDIHYIYSKVFEHTFKVVDLAISITPVADRCIQLSTQACNLHRQTLAVEWPYWRAQWLSTWHRHRMSSSNMSVCKMSALLELPRSTVSAIIVKCKCLGATTAQPRSGMPHKLTEQDCRGLKCATPYQVPNCLWKQRQHNNCLLRASWNGLLWPHTSLRSPCSMSSVGWWCKASLHWTLERWITLHHLAVRRTNLGLADAMRTLPAPTVKFDGGRIMVWGCF